MAQPDLDALRSALFSMESLLGKYQGVVEQLTQASAALRELLEGSEFAEERAEAVSAAKPFLHPDLAATLGQGVAPKARKRYASQPRWRPEGGLGGDFE